MKYSESTKGAFKALPAGITKKFLQAFLDGEFFVSVQGRKWMLDHKSIRTFRVFRRPERSLSIYFRSGNNLVRISDHWSSGSKAFNCGNIASCRWRLSGSSARTVLKFDETLSKGNLEGGFIKIAQLKHNYR